MGAMLCEWGKQACFFFLLLMVLSNIVQGNIRTIRASKKNCKLINKDESLQRSAWKIDKPIKFHWDIKLTFVQRVSSSHQ